MADDSASLLLIEVKVEGGKTSIVQLREVGKASEGVGKSSSVAAKGIKEHSEGYTKLSKAAKYVSLGGIALVTGATVEAAKAGVRWQKTIATLNQNLTAQGVNARGAADAIGRAAEKSSEHGGFGAEEQIGGYDQFISETHNKAKAQKALTETMNLARSSNMEFSAAEKMVSMALTGSTGRLEKQIGYIPKITEATKRATEAEESRKKILKAAGVEMDANERKEFQAARTAATFADKRATEANALAAIHRKDAGGMAAFSHTLAGTWSNLKDQVENVTRALGTKLLPIIVKVFTMLVAGVMWLLDHKTVAEIFLGIAAAIWLVATALTAYNAYMRIAAGLEEVLKVESATMWGPIGLAIMAVIVIVALLVTHFTLVKHVVSDVFEWIKGHWPLLLGILTAPIGLVVVAFFLFKKQIIGIFDAVVNWIETAFNNVLSFIESIPGKIVHAFTKLPALLGSVLKKIPGVGAIMGAVGGVGSALGLNAGGLVPAYASGGVVPGYGSSDSQPAMLTPGEFVIRKQAVQSLGVGTLNALNGTNQANPIASDGDEYVPIQIINKLDSRVLSESITRYTLKKKRAT